MSDDPLIKVIDIANKERNTNARSLRLYGR